MPLGPYNLVHNGNPPARRARRSAAFGSCLLASGLLGSLLASAPAAFAEPTPPLLHTRVGKLRLQFPAEIRATGTYVSAYPLDRNDVQSEPGRHLDTRLRIGFQLQHADPRSPWGFRAVYTHELLSGTAVGRPDVQGRSLPHDQWDAQRWMEGYAEISYARWVQLSLGMQTNRWGMGLVANDASHGAAFGSGRFSVPRHADRNLRAKLTLLPFLFANTELRSLAVVLAADRVWDDPNARYRDDDEAYQGIAALKWVSHTGDDIGLYAVRRLQRDASGRDVRVVVLDAAGTLRTALGPGFAVGAFEVATIRGTTSRAESVEHRRYEVAQYGAAASAGYETEHAGAWLDFVFASGDDNPFDDTQHAFFANPSFDMGLLLFEEVVAHQTGRAVHTASDPALVGIPPYDVERVASGTRITNAVVLSPRASVRPLDWLETYGRPIFAWTAVSWADPLSTNLAGGASRNALGGAPGQYYGTEIDLGIRAHLETGPARWLVSAEAGALFPGNAFTLRDGGTMGTVLGARLSLRARF
ncbi:MAG: hypothetical protein ACOC1F_05415 [Myxococcota bacterium]